MPARTDAPAAPACGARPVSAAPAADLWQTPIALTARERALGGEYMAYALALAAQHRGRTAPNPMVGAVVVRNGRRVGAGSHPRAGCAHAEPLALAAAGGLARGATLFVTLEPCHHTGRTGPCTAAILAAGIRRVVVGACDPDPRVQGRGLAYLRAQGVEVVTGLLAPACARLNAAYLWAHRTGRAYVVAKWAQSLDGRVATRTGASRWITQAPARQLGHQLRNRVDAILVGRGTLAADDPALTCRNVPGGRDPVRVVLARRAEVKLSAQVVRLAALGGAPTWVLVGPRAPASRCRALRRAGVRVFSVPEDGEGLSLPSVLALLVQQGCHSVLAEGGPRLLGGLFAERLVQRVYAFTAPLVIGGGDYLSVRGRGVADLAAAPPVTDVGVFCLGADTLIRGNVVP